jgi:hypothetical protein
MMPSSCGAGLGDQAPPIDLAGDGGGDQRGVGNHYRAVSSSTLHLAQGAAALLGLRKR